MKTFRTFCDGWSNYLFWKRIAFWQPDLNFSPDKNNPKKNRTSHLFERHNTLILLYEQMKRYWNWWSMLYNKNNNPPPGWKSYLQQIFFSFFEMKEQKKAVQRKLKWLRASSIRQTKIVFFISKKHQTFEMFNIFQAHLHNYVLICKFHEKLKTKTNMECQRNEMFSIQSVFGADIAISLITIALLTIQLSK